MFLSSLPKGKEKASGGYSQGGSNSLFFHTAGECILPSTLCSLGVYTLLSLATMTQSACMLSGLKGPHGPFGAMTRPITNSHRMALQ